MHSEVYFITIMTYSFVKMVTKKNVNNSVFSYRWSTEFYASSGNFGETS